MSFLWSINFGIRLLELYGEFCGFKLAGEYFWGRISGSRMQGNHSFGLGEEHVSFW